MLCYLVRIHLNSRVVEHERHELARALAVVVAVFLQFDEFAEPAHEHRLETHDACRTRK